MTDKAQVLIQSDEYGTAYNVTRGEVEVLEIDWNMEGEDIILSRRSIKHIKSIVDKLPPSHSVTIEAKLRLAQVEVDCAQVEEYQREEKERQQSLHSQKVIDAVKFLEAEGILPSRTSISDMDV